MERSVDHVHNSRGGEVSVFFRQTWLIGTLCIVGACGVAPQDAPSESTAAPAATPRDVTMSREQIQHAGIRWHPAEASTTADVVEVPGQLAPDEDRTVHLSAPARGRVVTVHVRIGDRVSRGQPLVSLQSEQAVSARAEYTKAVAELTAQQVATQYARTALERAERLLTLKAVSRQDVERARVEAESEEAMRTQAQADVERARSTLEQLSVHSETGEMVLRASLTGVVLSREVVPGSVVDAGVPLLTVTDPTTLWLDIAATERVAPVLRPGRRVRFTVPELAPQVFEATIENIGGALDPATRTLHVHGVVRNTSRTLRPAMFATVTLSLGEPRAGVAIPEAAIQLLDERPVVFVARPDEQGGARFERRDVEVGAKTGDLVQIVRGLIAGDVVVTDGAFAVKSEFARSSMSGG
jgi:RND family efflux transporter MFP subunit